MTSDVPSALADSVSLGYNGLILAEAKQPVRAPAAARVRIAARELRQLCDFWDVFPGCNSLFRKELMDKQ